MARKEIDDRLKELKFAIQSDNILIGTEEVVKSLRKGKQVKKIFLASNCPQRTKDDVEHYATLISVPVDLLDLDNEELGVFCKKNFFVSVLAIIRE